MIKVWTDAAEAGLLDRQRDRGSAFAYLPETAPQRAVSVTMPVRLPSWDVPFGLPPIFEMNLPEGALRERLRLAFAKATGTFDDFDLLAIVGRSQVGRIRYTGDKERLNEDVPFQSVDEILASRRDGDLFRYLIEKFAAFSGISGVQPKVLVRDENASATLAKGGPRLSPSYRGATHIVKFWEPNEFPQLAANEYFCLKAAERCELDVPRYRLAEDGMALVVDRFDLRSDGTYRGFEDFCVLNARRTDEKYRGSYETSVMKRFQQFANSPAVLADVEKLFTLIVLNCALRNGDAHLKNFGIIYDDVLGEARLAPVYDLVTTAIYLPKDSLALTLDGTTQWPGNKVLRRLGETRMTGTPAKIREILERVSDALSQTDSLGRFVKRGEKGIFILAPMVGRRSAKDVATDEATEGATTEGQRTLYGFRAVYVFDIGQTEGKELPTLTEVNGDVSGYRERLFKFVESQSVELSFSEKIAPAKGLSYGGKIMLLSGMQPAEEFSTLVHEIAHEMLHRGDRRTLTTKQVRETEAEAVAFVVCQSVGLQNGTASQDYIQLWLGDANLLRESLEAVQRTAAVILGAISPEVSGGPPSSTATPGWIGAAIRFKMKSMTESYEVWIGEVQQALGSIDMSMEDWQSLWPFDFQSEYKAGTKADDAAMKANRFWWYEQNRSLGQDCRFTPDCWLPRGHQGSCQPVNPDPQGSRPIPTYERGDYVKVEFPDETTGIGEWMWVRVTRCDEEKQFVFGILDNEPLNDYEGRVGLGSELAVSYSQVREHRKPTEFTRQ